MSHLVRIWTRDPFKLKKPKYPINSEFAILTFQAGFKMANQLLYVTAVYCYDFWTNLVTFVCTCPNKNMFLSSSLRRLVFIISLASRCPSSFYNIFWVVYVDACAIAPSGVCKFHTKCSAERFGKACRQRKNYPSISGCLVISMYSRLPWIWSLYCILASIIT